MNYKLKIFLPFTLGILFVITVAISSIVYFQNSFIDENIEKKAKEAEEIFYENIEKGAHNLNGLLDFILNDIEMQLLFLDSDRDNLFDEARPVFATLNSNYNITSLTFLDRKGEFYLDAKERKRESLGYESFVLKIVGLSQKGFYGIERDEKNNFVLRVVRPWIIAEELEGFIEMSENIDNISKTISNILNAEVLIAKKGKSGFEIDSLHSENLEEHHKYKILGFESGVHKFAVNSKIYYVNSIMLYDSQKNEIGKIFVLDDMTEEIHFMYTVLFSASALIIVVSIIALLIYYRFLTRLHYRLEVARKKLEMRSITDSLTKLYNRRYFNNLFPKEISRCTRDNRSISLLMIDVDFFKRYNDTYGHQQGDMVLKNVGQTIKGACMREADTVFRLGGEEFCVIVCNTNEDDGIKVAEKIKKSIEDLKIEHSKSDASRYITVSIGVATKRAIKELSTNEMYKLADEALYMAKESGRNWISFKS